MTSSSVMQREKGLQPPLRREGRKEVYFDGETSNEDVGNEGNLCRAQTNSTLVC